VLDELKKQNVPIYHKEGTPESGWILLDYGNVIAHIFSPERRSYYQLEQLWQEAPTVMKIL
jgi:ribosome-associated protein